LPEPEAPLVVAVVGSPRAHGNTSTLVDVVLEELARRGLRVEKVMLGACRVAGCLGHDDCTDRYACPLDDDAAGILDAVYAADGLILATPVYYENVSAQMKAFMDRNVFRYAHDEWLRAKVVGLVVVTAETGLDETLAALRRYVVLSTEGDVPTFSVGGYADTAGAVAERPELLADALVLAAELAEALSSGTSGRPSGCG
jgi:multimeric flavodoxin WrbA